MAASIKKQDTHEGTYVVEGQRILELTRVYYVTGLSSTDWQSEAVNTVGVWAWDSYPAPRAFMRAVGFDVEGLGKGIARVVVRYINSTAQYINGSSALETVETDKDRNDDPITLSNVGALKNGEELGGATIASGDEEAVTRPGIISVTRPLTTFSIRRIEANSALVAGGIDPLVLQASYVNRVNSTSFFGFPPGEVLCESINFDNDGLGDVAFNMAYEFRAKEHGWNPEAILFDVATGEPYVGLVQGVGRKIVDYYWAENLNALRF